MVHIALHHSLIDRVVEDTPIVNRAEHGDEPIPLHHIVFFDYLTKCLDILLGYFAFLYHKRHKLSVDAVLKFFDS